MITDTSGRRRSERTVVVRSSVIRPGRSLPPRAPRADADTPWTPSETSSPRRRSERFPWAGGCRARGRAPPRASSGVLRLVPRAARCSSRRRARSPCGSSRPGSIRAARPPRAAAAGARARAEDREAAGGERRRRPPEKAVLLPGRRRRRRRSRRPLPAAPERRRRTGPEVSLPSSGEGTGAPTAATAAGAGRHRRESAARSSTSRTSTTATTSRRSRSPSPRNWFKPTADHPRRLPGSTSGSTATESSAIPRSCDRADSPSSIAPPSARCSLRPSRRCPPTGRAPHVGLTVTFE